MSLRLNTDQNPITIPTASPSSEGLMSAADKTKLDGLTPGGAVFVNPPLTGDGSVLSPIDASAFLPLDGSASMTGTLRVPTIDGIAGNLAIGSNTNNGQIGTLAGAQLGWNTFQIFLSTPGGMGFVADDNIPGFSFTGAPIYSSTFTGPAAVLLKAAGSSGAQQVLEIGAQDVGGGGLIFDPDNDGALEPVTDARLNLGKVGKSFGVGYVNRIIAQDINNRDDAVGLQLVPTPTQRLGFFKNGGAAVVRQTGLAVALTNNVTVGGVNGTIANYTDLNVYANDAVAIRNDIYQLARGLKLVSDGLRAYGLLT